jgi:hypothetical protein
MERVAKGLVIATAHVTLAAVLATILSALVLAGVGTVIRAYRGAPDREPVSARRFWVGGLALVAAFGLVGDLLGELWVAGLALGSFIASVIDRSRRRAR